MVKRSCWLVVVSRGIASCTHSPATERDFTDLLKHGTICWAKNGASPSPGSWIEAQYWFWLEDGLGSWRGSRGLSERHACKYILLLGTLGGGKAVGWEGTEFCGVSFATHTYTSDLDVAKGVKSASLSTPDHRSPRPPYGATAMALLSTSAYRLSHLTWYIQADGN